MNNGKKNWAHTDKLGKLFSEKKACGRKCLATNMYYLN